MEEKEAVRTRYCNAWVAGWPAVILYSPTHPPQTSYLAYPSEEEGVVLIHDVLGLRLINKIAAHKNKLAALSFSLDGTLLATASAQGTVIRVFSVPAGERLYTLRRCVPTHPPTHKRLAPHSNRLVFLHPPTHPPTHPQRPFSLHHLLPLLQPRRHAPRCLK